MKKFVKFKNIYVLCPSNSKNKDADAETDADTDADIFHYA